MAACKRVAAAFLRLAAGAGAALAALSHWGVALIPGGWCWVHFSYLLLFVLGSGSLLLLGRWEGVAAGASCWLFLFLQYDASALRTGLAERLTDPVLIAGCAAVLAGLIRVLGGLVRRFPLSRGSLALGLSSLLVGVAFLLRPYWVARFRGHRADLRGAVLTMTDLRRADLSGADLRHANLRFASLDGADLKGASLAGADLRDTCLRRADLSGAELRRANLRFASLDGADLKGENLAGADLRDTCLDGADLRGANLTGAKLADALFEPETTRWPVHFDPSAHGAVERVWP